MHFRSNIFLIGLPPLHDRSEDIEALTHFFVKKYIRNAGRNIKRTHRPIFSVCAFCILGYYLQLATYSLPLFSLNKVKHFVLSLNAFKERGYWADFGTDTICLHCGELDIRFNPEEFYVDEVCQFEGNSRADSSIVYAITSSTGVKGTLVDAYGTYSERLNFKMAPKLHSHHSALHQFS